MQCSEFSKLLNLQADEKMISFLEKMFDNIYSIDQIFPYLQSFLFLIAQMRREGGKCSRVRGGISYCSVNGVLYMDNPDCDSSVRPNHSTRPRDQDISKNCAKTCSTIWCLNSAIYCVHFLSIVSFQQIKCTILFLA